jgi:excisionase family DNA binding protein
MAIEPLTMTISKAQDFSGLSRSKIYRALQAQKIRAIKDGSRTLILVESLRAYLANLPEATFRPCDSNPSNSST